MKQALIHLTNVIFIIIYFCSCGKINNDNNFSYKLLPVQKDKKWGYINHDGNWVVNPQFENAYLFSEGLAMVQSTDKKYGYIDDGGHYAINAQYVDATHFSEGYAMVVPENGYPTCIDKSGKIKFVLKEAETIGNFQEGLAWVKIGSKYGYINHNGKIVINPQFDIARDFSEDYAVYGIKNKDDSTKHKYLFGFINSEGKIVVNAQFKFLGSLKDDKASASTDGKKYGVINNKGVYIINPQFDDINDFSEGLAAVKQGASWGYINEEGKIVINPQFERAGEFSEGIAAVRSGKENWGYIDKNGKIIINPQFKAADGFHNNIALVASGEQIGLIDNVGKFKTNPQYEGAIGYYIGDFFPEYSSNNIGSVESDYFDGSLIAQMIIGDVVNGTGIRGFNNTTTYSKLKMYLPSNVTPSSYTKDLTDYEDKEIVEDITISKITYGFEHDLQKYSSGFFTSNYDYIPGGYVTDFDNTLRSIDINIDLSRWGRTKNKALKLAEAIKTKLIDIAKVSETGNDFNSTDRTRGIIPSILESINKDETKVIGTFLYGEKCQYLLITDIENNTVQIMAILSESKSYMPTGNSNTEVNF